MKCERCGEEFEPTLPARSEQRFCSPRCRKYWHYRAGKEAAYRRKVEKAEDRISRGLPLFRERPPLSVALGLAAPKPTIRVRSLRA